MNSTRWYMNIKHLLPAVGILASGMFLGWLFFAGSGGSGDSENAAHEHLGEAAETIWTCSMHPQIRQEEPGLCPICAMELIPLDSDGGEDSPGRLRMSEAAVQAANIRTVAVERGMPFRELRLPGKVQADETRKAEITARVAGRIEKLHVNVTGQKVRKGQKLAEIYAPQLIAAQKELLEAFRLKQSNPEYVEAARSKLRYWDLTDAQIAQIEKRGEVQRTMDILSPQSGTVLMRHVSEGDYVREGSSLFAIADLSRVWLQFDAYENDLAWLREGMTVRFTIAGRAGSEFTGTIAFIDPVIDPVARVAHVRVEMPNPGGVLKPEMFATGVVKSMLPGKQEQLVVPRSAVLWTGKRSVVWVRDPEADAPVFEYREVRLGAEAGDSYVVEEGLAAGEQVAADGVFSIDAAAQLQGKSSMMNPAGGKQGSVSDHSGHGSTQSNTGTVAAPQDFQRQLHALFAAYDTISSALIASDPSAVPAAVARGRRALGNVDAALLDGDAKLLWAESRAALRKQLDALHATRDIEKQRAAYAVLGGILHRALMKFGVEGDAVYLAFCPMAFDDAGAYWLTSSKKIRNPYFGDAMLKCGVIKGEIGK